MKYKHPTWPDGTPILIGDTIWVTNWPDKQGTITGVIFEYGEGEAEVLATFPHRLEDSQFGLDEIGRVDD